MLCTIQNHENKRYSHKACFIFQWIDFGSDARTKNRRGKHISEDVTCFKPNEDGQRLSAPFSAEGKRFIALRRFKIFFNELGHRRSQPGNRWVNIKYPHITISYMYMCCRLNRLKLGRASAVLYLFNKANFVK